MFETHILIIFTGLPISKVEFPSIVICSQGINIEAVVAAMYYYILQRLQTTTQQQFNFTPFQTANLSVRSFRKVWHLDICGLLVYHFLSQISYFPLHMVIFYICESHETIDQYFIIEN